MQGSASAPRSKRLAGTRRPRRRAAPRAAWRRGRAVPPRRRERRRSRQSSTSGEDRDTDYTKVRAPSTRDLHFKCGSDGRNYGSNGRRRRREAPNALIHGVGKRMDANTVIERRRRPRQHATQASTATTIDYTHNRAAPERRFCCGAAFVANIGRSARGRRPSRQEERQTDAKVVIEIRRRPRQQRLGRRRRW